MKLSDFLSFTPDGFFRSNKRSLKKYLSSGGVISSINDINDVNVTGAANGDALVYQDGEWVPGAGAGGGAVDSVNGQTGVVNLTKSDIGLSNVDNTSDLSKPISTATQTALNNKANSVHTHAISDVSGLQATLDGKASTGALSTLQTEVDGKAPIAAAVITGGTTGQVLKKASNANYDLVWAQDESTIYVATYADLPDPTTVSGKTYGVLASTGIAYISVLFGGNFRAKGFYYSNGTDWVYVGEFPMQASNAEVQASTVTDKFVAPNTLRSNYFYNGGNSFGGTATIGTSDNQALHFISNNIVRGKFIPGGIFSLDAFLGVGTENPISPVHIVATDIALTMGEASGSTGKMLLAGYNVASNYGFLQSIHQGTGYRPLSLNGNGGSVIVGGNVGSGALFDVLGTSRFAGRMDIAAGSASEFPLVITGALGQSSSLILLRNNSGGTLSYFDANGDLRLIGTNRYIYGSPGGTASYINMYDGTSGAVVIKGLNESGLSVLGALSVTGNFSFGGDITLGNNKYVGTGGAAGNTRLIFYEGSSGNMMIRSAVSDSGNLSRIRFQTGASSTDRMAINKLGQVGIGTIAPAASAIFEVVSTTRGFLPPRMTQAQRTAITSPAVGLMVYQTDGTEGTYQNTSSGWKKLSYDP